MAMLQGMTAMDRTFDHTPSAGHIRRGLSRLARLAAICLIVLSTAACSWLETVDPTAGSGGGGTAGGGGSSSGGGSGGGPVVPAVVSYTAIWVPSPSAGVEGYELRIARAGGGSSRTEVIPLAAASPEAGGKLSFSLDLETSRDHQLTMRAYAGTARSVYSNAIVVSASSLIASAADAAAAQAAPLAAMAAMPSATTHSSITPLDSVASNTVSSSDSQTAGEGSDARTMEIGVSLRSLEFDGGAHLVGVPDARVDASAMTVSTWLKPFEGGTDQQMILGGTDASGVARFELARVADEGIRVTVRDTAGAVVASAEFAGVLDPDVWQHVAVVVDPAAASPIGLRVDGLGFEGGTSSLPGGLPVIDGTLRLGDGYTGRMGHTAVFSRALDEAELETIDVWGHDLDLRDGSAADALLHYWRLDGAADLETDLGATSWPVDLETTAAGLRLVEDAPMPVEGVALP